MSADRPRVRRGRRKQSKGFNVKQAARSVGRAGSPRSAAKPRPRQSYSGSSISKAARFSPKKSLSQRFLRSDAIRDKILRSSEVRPEDVVVEIGSGRGELTEGLAERAKWVLAVEIDPDLSQRLEKLAESVTNLSVLCGSILELDLYRTAASYDCEKLVVVGNLPYHLTTQVILFLLEHGSVIRRATVMVQKEYADRLLASPGGRDYGAITLRTRYIADAAKIVDVPPTAFYPKPKVSSTVLGLTFRSEPAVKTEDEGLFFKIIRGTFGQRRKMLVNSLSKLSGLDKGEVKRVCRSVEIDSERRPETLSLEEFARLSDAFAHIK